MRNAVLALTFAMLAALGAFAPAASAATVPAGGAKVVIIVGSTHGATDSYRADANRAYAEAIKYSSNVVKVYSPNATWAKVKAATVGASIVVYFGHGNGWPSPYTYDPKYATKDGFGLNATAGNGDYNNKYYGEPYVSTLDLAPNAVVILSHLCYASGNSEPGNAAPTQTVARQRVDNYAAGFLKAAQAVIADGHSGPEAYIRALFTTHATIEELWQSAPNFHGHVSAFPSTRTPGATAYTDPDSATAGYYRSLVAKPGLTTDEVTGATYADTGVDPATLVVPGNAVVGDTGGSLYGADGQPTGSVPAGTRLRVANPENTISSTGAAAVHVQSIDDASIDGWMAIADLVPKDSAAPAVWGVDTGAGVVSPNADGRFDTATIAGRFSESVDWRLRVRDGGTVVRDVSGSGDTFSATWDGKSGGSPLPDGTYTFDVTAQDAWGNGPTVRTGTIRVDTVPAQIGAVSPDTDAATWFSPNGDAARDSVTWSATMTEPGTLVTRVYDDQDHLIRSIGNASTSGANPVTWDGKDDDGHIVADGAYEVRVTPRDVGGTNGSTVVRPVRVDTTLGFVTTNKTVFYPQDDDALAPRATLGYTLSRPATVTWTIKDASGAVVNTLVDGQAMAAGTWLRSYDGRRTDGTRLPTGTYTSVVTATDGSATASQAVTFRMMAFVIKPSDTTPQRGQKITVTGTSAERLTGKAKLYITQPGKGTWAVMMTKTSTYGYKVTITLKTGGPAGSVTFKMLGTDTLGNKQRTSIVVVSH